MEYLQCLYAFAACAGFCVVFHVRGASLFWMSLGGALGWLVYLLCAPLANDILQFFLGTAALSVYAEVMARLRRALFSYTPIVAVAVLFSLFSCQSKKPLGKACYICYRNPVRLHGIPVIGFHIRPQKFPELLLLSLIHI